MSPQATAFVAFAVVAGVLTVTPGVDSLLVLRTAVVAGSRPARLAGLGVLTGLLFWACAAGLGLAALLAASATAFAVLRIAGAVYLAALGARLLWRTVRRPAPETGDSVRPVAAAGRPYAQGLLTNLLNPKVGVFYLTLLPQFVVGGHSVLLVTAGLALIHVAEGALWFVVLSWLAVRIGAVLARRRPRQVLDALTGAVFFGFAARLALEAGR